MLRKLSALPTPAIDFLLGCILGALMATICYFAFIHGEARVYATPAKHASKKP
ncbi:hypothetical protein T2_00041 [Ralstonia phage Elie]|uniref:Uncharacterized protein n=4 Tax=Bakolyvirus TaxID=2843355 RepID=A0A7G5BBS0_9CAUD|nr:hypothetical protein KE332_gp41 [Ralstonia phage Adzire]YP_010052766.1 hypothetical protein KE333_gp17 [Ralstonia phage Bakoly]YP_010077728.1 hypothetical protein KMC38_gp41 [Ralstonia phage Simangalove]QMV32986.1 hypothetical protein T2_00041 [Ralstonia phage Elie]QMV33553.1 hypothetical protein 30B_00046 [Ralstonia phage Jenny]QMV33698.1 hypothetical protein S3_00054 [Ralstonia phage Sarlave]QMV32358.1 hypothetical protein S1_00041 [Ralstonia phage Adzire]QMV32590.1 hypothetical protein